MKTIGTTKDRGYLVELTQDEHEALLRLERVVEDKLSFADAPQWLGGIGRDMSDTFRAITHFVEARYLVQRIKGLVDDFEMLLMERRPETPEEAE